MRNTNTRPVLKGSIVRYQGGWMKVNARFKHSVNLTTVWGYKTKYKGIPLHEVYEDGAAQYEAWTQSESYQCM